jgi:hypothetical protein
MATTQEFLLASKEKVLQSLNRASIFPQQPSRQSILDKIARAQEILAQAETLKKQQLETIAPIALQRSIENPFQALPQYFGYTSDRTPREALSLFKNISKELGFSNQYDALSKEYKNIIESIPGSVKNTDAFKELKLLNENYFRQSYDINDMRVPSQKMELRDATTNSAIYSFIDSFSQTQESKEKALLPYRGEDIWNLRAENPQEYYSQLVKSATNSLARSIYSDIQPTAPGDYETGFRTITNEVGLQRQLDIFNELKPVIGQYVQPEQISSYYQDALNQRQQELNQKANEYRSVFRKPNKPGIIESIISPVASAIGFAMGGPLGAAALSAGFTGVQTGSISDALKAGGTAYLAASVGQSLFSGGSAAPISDAAIYSGGAEVFPVAPWADVTVTPIAGSAGAAGGSLGSSINLLDGVSFPGQGLQVPGVSSPELSLLPSGTNLPGLGLQLPSVPALAEMGGGAGLLASVPGGTVGSTGLTAAGSTPVLGDWSSFINQPDVLGQPVIGGGTAPITDISVPFDQAAYDATAGLEGTLKGLGNLAGGVLETLGSNLSPSNLLALGGGAQQPQVNPLAQGGVSGSAPRGVDYSSLLGLLQQQAKTPGLLGTRFQPQNINLASLLG